MPSDEYVFKYQGVDSAELAAVSLLADRHTQLVNVYQAMGGGWVDIAGTMAPEPQGVATATAP